ncbi:unnamed protein product [Phytophthora fragariaefolia]|uniref:Unnamed protein product n=1 Tax=Phytophthora fragariaefolia TaxID=1490495 RepID=A0A9W6XPL8_9STRA|nr:unnamed protein product [Phytophthora fragariaefolia]
MFLTACGLRWSSELWLANLRMIEFACWLGSETHGSATRPARDRVTKNEDLGSGECFYFYTNSIESTQYKGSNDDYEQYYVFGKPSYVETCTGGSTTGAGNTTMTPATPSLPTTIPAEDTQTDASFTTAPTTVYPGNTPAAASKVAGDANVSTEDYPTEPAAPRGCTSKARRSERG